MEVASNTSTILLPAQHISRVPPLPLRHTTPLMVTTEDSRNSVENDHSNTNSPRLIVDVNVPSSSASEATEPSPAILSLTPPPEGEQVKEPSEISPALNGSHTSQSKKAKRSNGFEEGGRKSRITRNRDDPSEVVNNYVDSKEIKKSTPRMIPPKGGRRIPFVLPKMELEKEKGKLQINMVGPKTKTHAVTENAVMKPRRSLVSQIGVGAAFQAEFDNFYAEDFSEPQTSRDEIPDRDDQLMWMDDRVKLKDKERELDDAWTAIRRQFNGKIGIDAMLHRLMLCNYDIDEMLVNIELEFFEELPQPFEEFNEGQQAEFERILSKTGGYQNGKAFRSFQEKFLKGYYMGEIIQYYYETKHRGCWHTLHNRCECRDQWIKDYSATPRYECHNCTKYLWGNIERSHRGQAFCSVCELYNTRNRRHRVPTANLTEPDEKLAIAWKALERKNGQAVTRNEFLQHLEEVRKENLNVKAVADELPAQKGKAVKHTPEVLFELTKKFRVKSNAKCSSLRPWGKEARSLILRKYSNEEKLVMVKAFHKHGLRTDLVALEVGKTESEVWTFYYLFNDQYLLDKVIIPPKKSLYLAHLNNAINTAENSNSPTPEPMTRRKRGASTDPAYTERREAPPPKSSRRTRQSAAAALQAEIEKAHANDQPMQPV